jgi:hypothetical protein
MTKSVKKSPREGIEDTRLRGREKQEQIFLWLAEYHYSTISIMSKFLGVSSNSQWHFFNRLIEAGLLRKIDVPTVREKVFLLTRDGKELACELTEKALDYVSEPSKVSVATVRHNLCVQLAVLERLKPGTAHTFEKHLTFTDKDKLPDAVLEYEGRLTALEIELSHKRTNRIYRAFYDHIRAMKDKHYFNVEYVFSSTSLRNNYKAKFDAAEWPVVERKDGRLRQTEKTFSPDSVASLRERFSFVVQNFDVKD